MANTNTTTVNGDRHDDHCNIWVDGGSCNCAPYGFCYHGYHMTEYGGGAGCTECRNDPFISRSIDRETRRWEDRTYLD